MDNNNNNSSSNDSNSADHHYMTVTAVPRLLLDPGPHTPDLEGEEEEFCCWNKNIFEISKLIYKKYLENLCVYEF